MIMQKAEIKDGNIVNVLEIDPDNIPDWCASWPNITGMAGIGWSYDGTQFFAPEPDLEELTADARKERDTILANIVDPLVSNPLRWADLTAEAQAEWAAYRRALLDVPQQEGFPVDIVWPAQPE
jgi:hypothetical protein